MLKTLFTLNFSYKTREVQILVHLQIIFCLFVCFEQIIRFVCFITKTNKVMKHCHNTIKKKGQIFGEKLMHVPSWQFYNADTLLLIHLWFVKHETVVVPCPAYLHDVAPAIFQDWKLWSTNVLDWVLTKYTQFHFVPEVFWKIHQMLAAVYVKLTSSTLDDRT